MYVIMCVAVYDFVCYSFCALSCLRGVWRVERVDEACEFAGREYLTAADAPRGKHDTRASSPFFVFCAHGSRRGVERAAKPISWVHIKRKTRCVGRCSSSCSPRARVPATMTN